MPGCPGFPGSKDGKTGIHRKGAEAEMDIREYEPLWGNWVTEEMIGAGSYGMVYRARQTVLGQTHLCAIKHISIPKDLSEHAAVMEELYTSDPETVKNYYEREAQSIAKEYDLQMQFAGKEHFVQVYDVLSVPKKDMPGFELFIRMELLNSIHTRFDPLNGHQRELEAIRLGTGICQALREMHARNLLHRDIKCQNILVSDAGIYKLADFGSAGMLHGKASYMSMKGTMDYIAPEIPAGRKTDYSSDLYALGLVLYRLLNRNRMPFASEHETGNESASMRRLTGEALPAPADASPEMSAVILKACAYRPEDRFHDAESMLHALEAIAVPGKADVKQPVPMPVEPLQEQPQEKSMLQSYVDALQNEQKASEQKARQEKQQRYEKCDRVYQLILTESAKAFYTEQVCKEVARAISEGKKEHTGEIPFRTFGGSFYESSQSGGWGCRFSEAMVPVNDRPTRDPQEKKLLEDRGVTWGLYTSRDRPSEPIQGSIYLCEAKIEKSRRGIMTSVLKKTDNWVPFWDLVKTLAEKDGIGLEIHYRVRRHDVFFENHGWDKREEKADKEEIEQDVLFDLEEYQVSWSYNETRSKLSTWDFLFNSMRSSRSQELYIKYHYPAGRL